jgi:hypothetical protein
MTASWVTLATMEPARATWTDERLDDLARRVDDGFSRLDEDMRSLRTEVTARIDGLQRTMLQLGGGLIAAYLVGFGGLIATQL